MRWRRTRTGSPASIISPSIRPSASTRQVHAASRRARRSTIVNMLGMVEPMANPGTVTFEKDGKSFTLEAVDEGDHRLFLIYRRPHQRPRHLRRRALPVRRVPAARDGTTDRGLQQGLQSALRVHRRSRPARCRRRRTGWTWRSPPARRSRARSVPRMTVDRDATAGMFLPARRRCWPCAPPAPRREPPGRCCGRSAMPTIRSTCSVRSTC